MNKIYPILVSILILVGCNNSAQHAALVQVDSLMTRNLASAYISLRMIDPSQLSKEDKAYYSLLQTTVQYKKCLPTPNDSIINIAIEYYTNHFDQNKLTRALMYKGAVLADLNFKKLALESYKEAEKVADTTDYLTMGLLNFRFGELYQKSYIKNDEHIKRYELSLQYFKHAKHDMFENDARIIIGQLYSTRNYDSAYLYLNKALSVAKELGNKQQVVNCSFILSNFYDYHNVNLEKSKDLALVVYQNRDSIAVGNDIYSHLAILYSKLDILDSANYFYRQCPMPLSAIDSMRYHMMQEEIAVAHNDYKTAYSTQKRATKIADFIVKQGKSEEYYAIDKEFDNHVANSKVGQLTIQRKLHLSLIIIISLSFLIVILIGVYIWRRKKRIFTQNQQLVDQLQTDILNQQSLTQDILEKNVLSISNLN